MLLRALRHGLGVLRPLHLRLPQAALEAITAEVSRAEASHAGEIRVVVEAALSWTALRHGLHARERALGLFASLGVWDTEHNNGVLVYLLLADRADEIIADRGIARVIPAAEWQSLCDETARIAGAGRLEEACLHVVRGVALRLARHFPAGPGEKDELPNQPVLI
jgi:hypothetical protein